MFYHHTSLYLSVTYSVKGLMSLKKAPGIIPALDTELGKSILYIDRLIGLKDEITGLKIGSDIIDNYGYYTTKALFNDIGVGYDIIIDLQKRATDIPDQIKKQVRDGVKNLGAKAYIGSPLGSGSAYGLTEKTVGSLEAFVDVCREYGIDPIVVLEMTQPGATRFSSPEACEELARISMELGVKYFVAPATRPHRIEVYRKIIGSEGEIISPGAGKQKTGDVVLDAVEAIKAGADHLVIGRGLLQADDPISTGKRIYEAALKAWQSR